MNIKLPPSSYPSVFITVRNVHTIFNFEDILLYFIYITNDSNFNTLYNFKYKNNWTLQGKNNRFRMQFNFVVDLQFCFPSNNRSWRCKNTTKNIVQHLQRNNMFTMQKIKLHIRLKMFLPFDAFSHFMQYVKIANRKHFHLFRLISLHQLRNIRIGLMKKRIYF